MTKVKMSGIDVKQIKNCGESRDNKIDYLSDIEIIVVGFIAGFVAELIAMRSLALGALTFGLVVFGGSAIMLSKHKNEFMTDFVSAILFSAVSLAGLIFAFFMFTPNIVPNISPTQYNLQLHVFYPNHPNITVIQMCSPIKTTALGYFNGEAIKPENTTYCNLPTNIAPYDSNPFNCTIIEKNITCVSTNKNENITWEGVVVGVN